MVQCYISMNEPLYREVALERTLSAMFGVDLTIQQMICDEMPVSRTAQAEIFLTPDKLLYVYIEAKSNLNLGDVKKIASKIGLVVEKYYPYKNQTNYFDTEALKKFHAVFPGRSNITESDLAYYRTLVPYHPALLLVREVKDGHIFQFDPDSQSNWRLSKTFSYKRLRTIS